MCCPYKLGHNKTTVFFFYLIINIILKAFEKRAREKDFFKSFSLAIYKSLNIDIIYNLSYTDLNKTLKKG